MCNIYYLVIFFCVIFIGWQIYVCLKYVKYDYCKVDLNAKVVCLKNEKIPFEGIEYCTLADYPIQPTKKEWYLSKGAYGIQLRELILHLKNGTERRVLFNMPFPLYKTLSELKPHVPINFDIEIIKENSGKRIEVFDRY